MIPITILIIVIFGINSKYPNTTPYMLCVAVLYSFLYTKIVNRRIILIEDSIRKVNTNVNCLHQNEKMIHSKIQKYERQNGKTKKNTNFHRIKSSTAEVKDVI